MSDLPHILFELTLTLIQDVLLLAAWRKWVRPRLRARSEARLRAEHDRLDIEHGVEHWEP